MKNNQNYLNIPSLRLSSKNLTSRAISSRSYKQQSPKFENYFALKSENQVFKSSSKQIKTKGNGQTPQDEDMTRISFNQGSENLNQQSYLIPLNLSLRDKRSKSTIVSQKNIGKIRNQRLSEAINPKFPTFPSLHDKIYENEVSQRRQQIQKTKKQVQEFNQKNFKLLNDIKDFRQQISKRKTLNLVDKKPLQFVTKEKRKNSIICFHQKQQKENLQQKSQEIQEEQQKKFTNDDFQILKKMGSGKFATVYLAVEKNTGFLVTLKKISRNNLKTQKSLKQVIMEIKIQTFLDHPNVLKIYGFFVDQEAITLILEFMQQGNLYEKIMKEGSLKQEEASQSIAEVLFALEYLHQNNIVYRDLKPQNVLYSHGVRKLCDFGTANICEDRRSTLCGTLDYSAPQLIQGKQYNIALDLWSIGVMTFELLTSKTPFYHARRKDTIKQISQYEDGQIKFPQNVSKEAQNFISSFLVKNPQKRAKIKDALNEEFISQFIDEQTRQLRQKYASLSIKRK